MYIIGLFSNSVPRSKAINNLNQNTIRPELVGRILTCQILEPTSIWSLVLMSPDYLQHSDWQRCHHWNQDRNLFCSVATKNIPLCCVNRVLNWLVIDCKIIMIVCNDIKEPGNKINKSWHSYYNNKLLSIKQWYHLSGNVLHIKYK